MLVLGIICVAVAGPVLMGVLSMWPVVPKNTQTIQEGTIVDAYAFPFTITNDDQISVHLGCTTADTTVDIVIITKGTYDALYATAAATPGTGLYFVYSTPTYGASPTGTRNNAYQVSTTNAYVTVDFGGSATSTPSLIFIPGTYVVVVSGNHAGSPTDVVFDITIEKEIFGRTTGRIVNVVGWGLIIGFGIISLILVIKKTLEARV